MHADADLQAGSRTRTDVPTLKIKLVSYNQAIPIPPEPVEKLECARAPATLATTATVDAYRAALAAFRKRRPYGVVRLRHDQACWAAEMFLNEWQDMAADWPVTDIFARNGLAWWLGTELVTALGPEHAVTEARRIYNRVMHKDWLNSYGMHGNALGNILENSINFSAPSAACIGVR